jgi:hypothetical protein
MRQQKKVGFTNDNVMRTWQRNYTGMHAAQGRKEKGRRVWKQANISIIQCCAYFPTVSGVPCIDLCCGK